MAEPTHRPDEGAQPTALGDCVANLTDAITRGVGIEIERHGLEPNEFAILRFFWERDVWTATELAELLPADPSRLSRLVANLVDRHLLHRRRAKADRRVVLLTLTPKGTRLMTETRKSIQAYEAILLDGVSSKEMAGLLSATHKILRNHLHYEHSRHE